MIYADKLAIKKEKLENLIAEKLQGKDYAQTAIAGEKEYLSPILPFLKNDLERYDLEIEALQTLIDTIDNDLRKQANETIEI